MPEHLLNLGSEHYVPAGRIAWSQHKPLINQSTLITASAPNTAPKQGSEEDVCPVCHDALDTSDSTMTHSSCRRVFHINCLETWQQQQQQRSNLCLWCQEPYVPRLELEALQTQLTQACWETFRVAMDTFHDQLEQLYCFSDDHVLVMDEDYLVKAREKAMFIKSRATFRGGPIGPLCMRWDVVNGAAEDRLEHGDLWADVRDSLQDEYESATMSVIGELTDLDGELDLYTAKMEEARQWYHECLEVNPEQVHELQTRLQNMAFAMMDRLQEVYMRNADRELERSMSMFEAMRIRERLDYHYATGLWAPVVA